VDFKHARHTKFMFSVISTIPILHHKPLEITLYCRVHNTKYWLQPPENPIIVPTTKLFEQHNSALEFPNLILQCPPPKGELPLHSLTAILIIEFCSTKKFIPTWISEKKFTIKGSTSADHSWSLHILSYKTNELKRQTTISLANCELGHYGFGFASFWFLTYSYNFAGFLWTSSLYMTAYRLLPTFSFINFLSWWGSLLSSSTSRWSISMLYNVHFIDHCHFGVCDHICSTITLASLDAISQKLDITVAVVRCTYHYCCCCLVLSS